MKTISIFIFALMLGLGLMSFAHPAQAQTKNIKIYLVAVDDNGKHGRKIGCNDSLIPVSRRIRSTGSPLKAALEALLSTPEQSRAGGREVGNFWKGSDLKVSGVSINKGTATIKISGTLSVAGVCDEPRITEQIEATARQFATVRRVKVTINGEPLKQAIR